MRALKPKSFAISHVASNLRRKVVRAVISNRVAGPWATRPVLFSRERYWRGPMDKVHLILESQSLRDMLEYAFVEGGNAQREVSKERPDRPLLVKQSRKEDMIAKLMSQPGSLALRWDMEKQRWEVL
jgi:hypothetical protein